MKIAAQIACRNLLWIPAFAALALATTRLTGSVVGRHPPLETDPLVGFLAAGLIVAAAFMSQKDD